MKLFFGLAVAVLSKALIKNGVSVRKLAAVVFVICLGQAQAQTFSVGTAEDYNLAAGTIRSASAATNNALFEISIAKSFTGKIDWLSLSGSGNSLEVRNSNLNVNVAATGFTPQFIFGSTAGTVVIFNNGNAALSVNNAGAPGTTGATGLDATTDGTGAGGAGGAGGNGIANGSAISLTGTGVVLSATNDVNGRLSVSSHATGGAGGAGGVSGSSNSGAGGTSGASGNASDPGGLGTDGGTGNQGGQGGKGGSGTATGVGISLTNSGGANSAVNNGKI
ncbi:MAG: hypothetical protein WCO57_04735 [Verrucomicrobiota bacterium]